MKNKYFPTSYENRMRQEGNVVAARSSFLNTKNRLLYNLVKQRFAWMNDYIHDTDDEILELGCGAGLSKLFIKNEKLVLTDVLSNDWVDEYMDALNINRPDESIDVIICSHMIHHIAYPAKFFHDVSKKLKKGGRIIIQDIYTGFLMKLALRAMRHEGWSDLVDVFDFEKVCNSPEDPWSANCSIPKLLFFDAEKRIEKEFPMYRLVKVKRNECFTFLFSGGVIAKTVYLPVGERGVRFIQALDQTLISLFPEIFTCGCSIVLEKK